TNLLLPVLDHRWLLALRRSLGGPTCHEGDRHRDHHPAWARALPGSQTSDHHRQRPSVRGQGLQDLHSGGGHDPCEDLSLLSAVQREGGGLEPSRWKRSDRSVRKRWTRSSPSSTGTSSIIITCGFTARLDGSHQRISWLAAKARSGRRETSASRPLAKLDESGALALEDRPQCVTPHIGCHVHAEPKQDVDPISHQRQPQRMLDSIVIMVESLTGI